MDEGRIFRGNCANFSAVLYCHMATKQHATKLLCHCDCGGSTKGGRYLPGHDAKHKKALIEAALLGGKRAANKLEKLGWTKFLESARSKGFAAKTATH